MQKCAVILALSIAIPLSAQERFPTGEYKGFTISPIEHIIVGLQKPIHVTSVRGSIVLLASPDPLLEVLFEIRGPGNSEQILSATTDASGHFKIPHVHQGTCKFKATKGGFQSVTGTLIVSKHAERHAGIKIELPVGV
jgi:hypothetical protein